MIDRVLALALNLVIVAMISTLSAASLACAHWGVLRMLAGTVGQGVGLVGGSAMLAMAGWLLIRHRNELVDR